MNYDKFINSKSKQIVPSGIRKFFDVVATMKDAISLGVGEPDFDTPWEVREAAIKSIQKGYTQYTSNAGLLQLRELISQYLLERYQLQYQATSEVVVTVGASEAIDLALRVIISPGDEVLVPDPSYVSYAPGVLLSDGIPVAVPCDAKQDFKLTPEWLLKKITPRTKAIILPYPNNPTGAIMEREYLLPICDIIKRHDLIVISDEIYSELTYDGIHTSIASVEGMRERTIVINGFSKSFAMTGWRLGYFAAPEPLASVMLKVHQYVIMCAPTAAQYAAVKALSQGLNDGFEVVEHMRSEYDKRRRFMVESFLDMGLDCFTPKGAFYVFPSVKKTGLSGDDFADQLLKNQKVAVVPGSAFGESGKDYIRCSYAYSMKSLDIAIKRIASFVREHV